MAREEDAGKNVEVDTTSVVWGRGRAKEMVNEWRMRLSQRTASSAKRGQMLRGLPSDHDLAVCVSGKQSHREAIIRLLA